MIPKRKIFFAALVIYFGLFGLTDSSWSDSVDYQDAGFIYSFHLYLNQQNQLVKDRDLEFPFDLIAKEYKEPSLELGQKTYRGEIVSIKRVVLYSFLFSPEPGKVTIEAPYFPNAQTALFYNLQDQLVLTLDLAPGGPVCNEDGVCQSEYGESSENCPADCGFISSPSPSPSAKPFFDKVAANNFWLIGGGTAAFLILIAVWFWRRKVNQKNVLPPPQI